MSTGTDDAHRRRAETLRAAMAGATGITEAALRTAVAARAAGGSPLAEPYDDLARQIGDASYQVTDAEVDAVRQTAGSDKAAFEIVMSACIGAGLARWDAAARVIAEATDAPA
ncbi:hypothetical protein AMES_5616 [Amycolatopsis mediterranei S699]|uniref:Carboxymuconolactone decarboxylase n=2 Tax=Amycolatopsis mediterranei TaxID=33910 RepID=A0A0H3D9W6_AMYMU|nr:hypothetical protein [Amycolatopsis mediterranei]ADJ47441.1 conserved hypothetical protein [Amycolatopsis mediterranei U32]AEK44288.1 hypothetical protein RAM_29055 [Amycolatopsis mediterranei S699]AFO79152.1 hypothetical protein AMES_5616 [Amycolatopsis mediterranei S699]AGT86280.1 hypothetical protein B737_5616 [Amycolatopsis mediterranei RB]KDO12635.1 hypothetical protein DV26_01570 [Amycolatopsis mediterranei]